MVDIPASEPAIITAGDTVKWTKNLTHYKPEDGWTLKYYFVINGAQNVVTATDNGDSTHLATISAASSASYAVGIHDWQARAEKAGEKYTVDSGTMRVETNFETQTSGYDNRSHVKKTLDAIEAVIEGSASKEQQSYAIGGRSLSLAPKADLLMLRDKYRAEYVAELKAEKIENGEGHSGKIMVRFT